MKDFSLFNFNCNKAFIHRGSFPKHNYHDVCIDTDGNILFELRENMFSSWKFEDENVAFVGKSFAYHYELTTLVNHKGEFLTDFLYDVIYGGAEEGFFEVSRNGKHGHIDLYGQEVIPCIYEKGSYFSEGIATEKLNGKWGCVDFKNNIVIPFEYEDIELCKNNIIPAKQNGKWGLIDKFNNILCQFEYDYIHSWGNRENVCTLAQKNSKTGFIDKNGDIIVDFDYDTIEDFYADDDGNFYKISKNGKYALFSCQQGKFVTDFVYSDIGYYTSGLFETTLKNKKGFIDINGNVVIPFIYDHTDEYFHEGVIPVKKNGKCGVIDRAGNIVIPIQYKKISYCNDGLLKVIDFDYKEGYINKKNEIVIPFGKYHSCSNFSCGFAAVSDDNGSFYVDKTDTIKLIPTYENNKFVIKKVVN